MKNYDMTGMSGDDYLKRPESTMDYSAKGIMVMMMLMMTVVVVVMMMMVEFLCLEISASRSIVFD